MRVVKWAVIALVVGGQTGCDRIGGARGGSGGAGQIALSLEAPETLDWGGAGTIRLALQNQGSGTADGAIVEVHLPTWLEFGSVEPDGTEVTLVAGDEGTRLAYRMTAPLEPGERREVVQHVRVPDTRAPAARVTPTADDTLARVPQPPPPDRLMRARLVDANGRPLGAEVQAVLAFRGAADDDLVMQPAGAGGGAPTRAIRSDGVDQIRLGMSAAELRQAAPDARDTTLAGSNGGQQRAVLVAPGGGAAIAAILGARGVERILVRDTGYVTERGLGVGSQLGELRAAYGQECVEPLSGGRFAVSFVGLPGVAFAVTASELPAGTASQAPLPDSARVTEVWVGARPDSC